MITATGIGSWVQIVSAGELIEAKAHRASINFTGVSKIDPGHNTIEPSWRHFQMPQQLSCSRQYIKQIPHKENSTIVNRNTMMEAI